MDVKHLYLEDGCVNPSFGMKPIVIWGTGGDGEKLWGALTDEAKANVEYFIDSNLQKKGRELHGKVIRHPGEIESLADMNIGLAFHTYPTVIDNVLLESAGAIFADYRYEYESDEHCILCGGECVESKAHFADFIIEREFLGTPSKTKLVTCKKCGFSFSSYRPNDEEMTRLYSGYRNDEYFALRHTYESGYTKAINEKTLQPEHIKARQDQLYDFVSEFFHGNGLVADYGGDEGQFIPRQFHDVQRYVFDISGNKTVDGVERITDIDKFRNGKWNFVMCCHLLEHVANPREIIANMVSGAKVGGYIYIEVPFEENWKVYSDYEFHEHINFYSGKFFEQVGLGELRLVKIDCSKVIRVLYCKVEAKL